MGHSNPERQKPERTRIDDARDEILLGLTNVPPELAGYPTTPSEHIEGIDFEAKTFIVDTVIEQLKQRGFIDPSAFREQTPEEAARTLGVREGTIERWRRMGLLSDVSLPVEIPRFTREAVGDLRKEMGDDMARETPEDSEDSGEENQGDDQGEGGSGVREPRRPYPGIGGGEIELMPDAREAFAASKRDSVEFILGYELSDQEWDDLVLRMTKQTHIEPNL